MRFISKSWLRAAVTLGAAALAACASTDYHYSQLIGQRYYRTPIDTYEVTITRVDGKDSSLRPALVEPGPHKVLVQGPRGGGANWGEFREIALDVRPCIRYYLVAVKSNPLASDFHVRVDYEEPVGGCTPPARS